MSKSSMGSVVQAIESIQRAYAPTKDFNSDRPTSVKEGKPNEDCEFKSVMYNRKVGNLLYQDPLLGGPMLEQAEHNNPDPDNFYPVCELGIDALSRRIENQKVEVGKINEHMKNITDIVQSIDQSNGMVSLKCNDLKMRQLVMFQRLLIILRKVETLRCHGVNIQDSEHLYRQKLVKILHVMKEPFFELQDLSNKLGDVPAQKEEYTEFSSEDEFDVICDTLQKQREGLEQLTDILNKDIRDINIIRSTLSESATEELYLTK